MICPLATRYELLRLMLAQQVDLVACCAPWLPIAAAPDPRWRAIIAGPANGSPASCRRC